MVIGITVEQRQPLVASAGTEAGERLPFEGWLHLLRVISRLVGSSPELPTGAPR